jgi:hypothetical protein
MVRGWRQHGVTYLWMLFLVFLLGLGLGKSLEVYSTIVQREKEAELIHVGSLYREAIRQFYLSSPGSVKRYPASLDELLKDPRSLATRRYLRRLYPDPMTGQPFALVQAPEGGIWGVASTSSVRPLRTSPSSVASSAVALSYREWKFLYAGVESDCLPSGCL